MQSFPKTKIGGIEVSRMIIGTNWILGYSHCSEARSKQIININKDADIVAKQFETYLEYDVNTVIGPMQDKLVSNGSDGLVSSGKNLITEAARLAEERTGKKMVLIPTTGFNTEDSENGRKEAKKQIEASAKIGAKICYLAFDSIDRLLNHDKKQIDRLDDYTYMVREAGMVPMIGNHSYTAISYADRNENDVECYLTPYNCQGFYMHAEVEGIHSVIAGAKKPVITIKAMAAGRMTPFVGLTFNYSTIRPCDMVAVGALNSDEAREDIKISLNILNKLK